EQLDSCDVRFQELPVRPRMAGHHGQGPLAFDINLTFTHLTYQPGRPGFCGLARSTRMPVAHGYATGTIDHRSSQPIARSAVAPHLRQGAPQPSDRPHG